MDLSNISDSVDNTVLLSETSIQYRSFEVTSLKVLDAESEHKPHYFDQTPGDGKYKTSVTSRGSEGQK